MPIGSPQWMYASGEDFTIDQSLRFNTASSANLTRYPSTASSATDRRKFTISFWFKPDQQVSSSNPDSNYFWGAGSDTPNNYLTHGLEGDGTMWFGFERPGSYVYISSTRKFRDHSAWYHCVFQWDTTQATGSNRVKIYINNERITDWTHNWASTTDYSAIVQNGSYHWNDADYQYIGSRQGNLSSGGVGTLYYGGYMAEFHNIDGSIVAPTSFGETGDYGEWKPKEYDTADGAYGTNGFYLSFAGGGIMSATGGDSIGTDGDYKYNTFLSNGTFTPSVAGYVEYLVIAGGGSGGCGTRGDNVNRSGGGGGAGGYRPGTLEVAAQAYSITVGAGGAAVVPNSGSGANPGLAGSNSVFSTITSIGGGGGGSGHGGAPGSGGSGGGGAHGGTSSNYGAGTAGQGNDGGYGTGEAPYSAGGGGGAGSAGTYGSNSSGSGAGGSGKASSITGSSVTRAGGGGGGGTGSDGAGGSGGGTAGDSHTAATANTGSGGGGTGNSSGNTGAGGSGIVIIRYKFQ